MVGSGSGKRTLGQTPGNRGHFPPHRDGSLVVTPTRFQSKPKAATDNRSLSRPAGLGWHNPVAISASWAGHGPRPPVVESRVGHVNPHDTTLETKFPRARASRLVSPGAAGLCPSRQPPRILVVGSRGNSPGDRGFFDRRTTSPGRPHTLLPFLTDSSGLELRGSGTSPRSESSRRANGTAKTWRDKRGSAAKPHRDRALRQAGRFESSPLGHWQGKPLSNHAPGGAPGWQP